MIRKKLLLVLSLLTLPLCAADYTFPDDLTGIPGCKHSYGNVYKCDDGLEFDDGDHITVESDVIINSGDEFDAEENLTIETNGSVLKIQFGDDVQIGDAFTIKGCVKIRSGKKIVLGENGYFEGALQSGSGNIEVGEGSVVKPCFGLNAAYRMDACYWDGSAGEVKDSSGNGYDGTARDATTEMAKLCRGGDFSADGTSDYVSLDHRALDGLGDFSVSVWIKTSQSGNFAILSGANSKTANEALMWFMNDGKSFHPFIHGHSKKLSISDVSDGQWHHLVWTRHSTTNCLYVDGSKEGCVDIGNGDGPVKIDTGGLIVAQEQDSVGGGFDAQQDFEGVMDELEIFSTTLSDAQVQTIYNNEKSGKNYEGSARTCPCLFEIAGEYRLDACRWSGTDADVIDDSGQGGDLTARNGAYTTEGRVCRSGHFDGSDDKLTGKWHHAFHNAVTLTAWIRTKGGHGTYARVVEFSSHNGHYKYSTALAYDKDGKILRGWTANAKGLRSKEVAYNMKVHGYHDGRWHHVAYVYDGTKALLYVDGQKVDEESTDIKDVEDATTLAIGGYYPEEHHSFNGEIDEVKIFSNALSPMQIKMIYDNETKGKNYNGSRRICRCLMPRAAYRMDACYWDGSAGEVKDSSGNGYDGTARDATTEMAKLCRGGDFSTDGTSDYVSLDHRALDGLGDFSVSVWIKTSQSGNFAILSGANSKTANEALMWFMNDGKSFHPFIHGHSKKLSISDVSDGQWHHLVWTRHSTTNCLYVDGSKEGCVDIGNGDGPVKIDTGGLIVAQEQDSVGGDFDAQQDFEGVMDELEIFDAVLDERQVQRIYENEGGHLDPDGTDRYCPCCAARSYSGGLAPLQFEGEDVVLHNTLKDPTWTHISFKQPFSAVPVVFILPTARGGHPAATRIKNVTTEGFDAIMAEPQGEDGPHYDQHVNYLAITPGIHKVGHTVFEVGTVATKKQQQASRGKVKLDEWTEVPSIFQECQPAVAAQIQSLKNERGLDSSSHRIIRSYPWMTVAVDTNSTGIHMALERSETDEGDIDETETVGYMLAEGNIQDSFSDDLNHTITFETLLTGRYFMGWDDECRKIGFKREYDKIPLIAATKNSRYEKDGGWLRRCALDKEGIGLQIDEDGSAYSKWIYGYREPPQDRERHHAPEKAAIFVFSGSFVVRESEVPHGYFDAWDRGRPPGDRNISTKIAGEAFALQVVSLTEEGSDVRDFNGTVCLRLVGKEDRMPLSGWRKALFSETNTTVVTLQSPYAAQKAAVHIVWKRNVDADCPLTDEENATDATDLFAIRPEKFLFESPAAEANLTAEHHYDYPGGVKAVGADGAPVKEYNTTVVLNPVKTMRNGEANDSLAGTFSRALSDFADGEANLSFSFNDVGIIVMELNDTLWAAVDADDTPEANRTVYGERKVVFIPHRFELLFPAEPVMEDNDTANGFTYLSDDLAMSAWLRGLIVDVRALGEEGGLMRNFSNPMDRLFADPVDVDPLLRLPDRHSPASTLGAPVAQSGADLNFSAGEAVLSYGDVAFNYERVFDVPVDPFGVEGSEANITVSLSDAAHPGVAGSVMSSFGGGARFYYGRLYAEDVRTTEASMRTPLRFEVYDDANSSMVGGFERTSLHWYLNTKHTGPANGKVRDADVTADASFQSAEDPAVKLSYGDFSPGYQTMEINNTDGAGKRRMVHLDVDPWLWYVPEGFGESYLYGDGSDCSRHPCFEYRFIAKGQGNGVLSGDFNGSDFDAGSMDANATYRRRHGVKLFR
ncbi:LamG-like jellyroll fold domain-containing protein [Hydrogenimonas sp. SS33]|uniref:LamG-like jellyroll fold domain-containing protein n=1 Tax=Hydrogenimonas leucolamina TaxID=2954236 RepID=UPI00336BF6C6